MTDDTTPYHGLDTPSEGASNWHEPLNENFERLDREVMLSGTYADRPDPGDDELSLHDGAKFHATDVNAVFVWDAIEGGDGGEWTALNSGTADDPIPGTTHRESVAAGSVRTASEPVANVKRHGAAGDGETDDLAALEAAVEAVAGDDGADAPDAGGVVYLPPGEYLVSDTWHIEADGVSVRGDGDVSTVVADGELATVIDHEGSHYSVRDLAVDGVTSAARGLVMEGTHKTVENCTVRDCRTVVGDGGLTKPCGIWDRGGHTTITDCHVAGIHGLEAPDESNYDDEYPGSAAGIQSNTGGEGHEGTVTIVGNTIEEVRYVADADGVRIGVDYSSRVVVRGNVFRNCHKGDVKVQGDHVDDVVVSDNVMVFDDPDYATYAGVRIQTGNATVANNVIHYHHVDGRGAFVVAKDRDVTVTGNECTLESAATPDGGFDGITVQGNDLYSSTEYAETVVVADNVVTGPVYNGITMTDDVRDVTVSGNVVTGVRNYCVTVAEDDATAAWIAVTGNVLRTGGADVGVRIETGTDVIVDGNSVEAVERAVSAVDGDSVTLGTNHFRSSAGDSS